MLALGDIHWSIWLIGLPLLVGLANFCWRVWVNVWWRGEMYSKDTREVRLPRMPERTDEKPDANRDGAEAVRKITDNESRS